MLSYPFSLESLGHVCLTAFLHRNEKEKWGIFPQKTFSIVRMFSRELKQKNNKIISRSLRHVGRQLGVNQCGSSQ